jgi:hypothetical protein
LQGVALKGWWLCRMSQPRSLQWLELALLNLKEHFIPRGWTIPCLFTSSQRKPLQYHGLWRDIYISWGKLHGHSQQSLHSIVEDNPFCSALLAGKDIGGYTVRDGHRFLTSQSSPPNENKWVKLIPGLRVSWGSLWTQFWGVRNFLPPNQTLFWWRFLQHNLMTGAQIHHMNPAISSVCHLCSSDQETLSHLFWKCPMVRSFWGHVFHLLHHLVPGNQVLTPELSTIVNPFCFFPKSLFPVIASIHGTALWSIWKIYLGVVFDGKIFNCIALDELFLSLLSSNIHSLYYIACKRQKIVSFIKLWDRSPLVCINSNHIEVSIFL